MSLAPFLEGVCIPSRHSWLVESAGAGLLRTHCAARLQKGGGVRQAGHGPHGGESAASPCACCGITRPALARMGTGWFVWFPSERGTSLGIFLFCCGSSELRRCVLHRRTTPKLPPFLPLTAFRLLPPGRAREPSFGLGQVASATTTPPTTSPTTTIILLAPAAHCSLPDIQDEDDVKDKVPAFALSHLPFPPFGPPKVRHRAQDPTCSVLACAEPRLHPLPHHKVV